MKKGLLKIFLLVGLLFIGINAAYADDNFTVSVNGAKDVKPGDEFTVDVTIKGPTEENTLNGYDIKLSYDTNKLTVLEGGQLTANDLNIIEDTTIGTVKLRVNDGAAVGDTPIKFEGTVLNNGEADKTKFNGGTISIRNIGTDNTLKSLKIPNTVLSPDFNSNVHDYTATVTDVTSIEIKAETNEPHASVWTNGVDGNLQKGENDVVIVCKSESGQENYYSIKVTLNMTPTPEELKAQDATLQTLSIKGQKLDFSSTEKKYYINVDYDQTKIDITATPNNPEAEVVITGNTKLIVGKNTVKINVTSQDKTKTDTYQIIVTRANEEKEIVKTCPDETSKKEWIIFTASLLLTFTLGIVLGYFLCRKEVLNKIFKKKNKEEAPVEIETLSDTIDLSDTVKKVSTEEPKDNTKK